jgi:hypothetical protein
MDSCVNAEPKRNRSAVENAPCSAARRLRDPSWSMYFAKCGQVVDSCHENSDHGVRKLPVSMLSHLGCLKRPIKVQQST